MYFSNTALAAACIVVLVKAEGEANDSNDEDNPVKKETKENQYTELSDFYTFVALIDIVFKDRTKRTCTGAIIHDNVVITAAHCFLGKNRYANSKPELTASFVVIGTKTMFETGYEQYLPIEKFITHPLFEGWTADLALVYTFAGMTSDKPGSIIALAGDMSAHVDSNVTVYSWGEDTTTSNEAGSEEPRPKKKNTKTTAYEPCSEEDQSGGLRHRKTKGSKRIIDKRFRNSEGDDYGDNARATKLQSYGKRLHNLRGGFEDSSIERLGKKRTAMFHGNRLWSLNSDSTLSVSTTREGAKIKKMPKFGKVKKIHKRAEVDEIGTRVENRSKTSAKEMIKPTDDYDDMMVGENYRQTTKRKSRYLANDDAFTKIINVTVKPYKFVESADLSDSFEKQLLKKHLSSSKSTRYYYKKFSISKEMGSKFTKERYFSEGKRRTTAAKKLDPHKHHATASAITKKKKKITGMTTKPKKGTNISNFRTNGWRRSLGSQHNQLFVGSFGYVNIQGCRALVEKAMPPKYEISKGNDAICYTSTRRCIGETGMVTFTPTRSSIGFQNDSGAPAVRQGRLIAITVGGAQCEGDNVAVGMKMNCYCSWISDNLPPGSDKLTCCKDCCDLKHKEVMDDNKSKEKPNKMKYKS